MDAWRALDLLMVGSLVGSLVMTDPVLRWVGLVAIAERT